MNPSYDILNINNGPIRAICICKDITIHTLYKPDVCCFLFILFTLGPIANTSNTDIQQHIFNGKPGV